MYKMLRTLLHNNYTIVPICFARTSKSYVYVRRHPFFLKNIISGPCLKSIRWMMSITVLNFLKFRSELFTRSRVVSTNRLCTCAKGFTRSGNGISYYIGRVCPRVSYVCVAETPTGSK